jgi:hypothetical protein
MVDFWICCLLLVFVLCRCWWVCSLLANWFLGQFMLYSFLFSYFIYIYIYIYPNIHQKKKYWVLIYFSVIYLFLFFSVSIVGIGHFFFRVNQMEYLSSGGGRLGHWGLTSTTAIIMIRNYGRMDISDGNNLFVKYGRNYWWNSGVINFIANYKNKQTNFSK